MKPQKPPCNTVSGADRTSTKHMLRSNQTNQIAAMLIDHYCWWRRRTTTQKSAAKVRPCSSSNTESGAGGTSAAEMLQRCAQAHRATLRLSKRGISQNDAEGMRPKCPCNTVGGEGPGVA